MRSRFEGSFTMRIRGERGKPKRRIGDNTRNKTKMGLSKIRIGRCIGSARRFVLGGFTAWATSTATRSRSRARARARARRFSCVGRGIMSGRPSSTVSTPFKLLVFTLKLATINGNSIHNRSRLIRGTWRRLQLGVGNLSRGGTVFGRTTATR